MICKNCGKEIPDDAKFCGFCGAPVTAEKKDETPEPTILGEEKKAETPMETVPAEDAAKPSEEAEEHTLGDDISGTIKNTAAGKVLLGDDGKLDKDDFARMGGAAKNTVKSAYKSVDWNEFKTFIQIFKDPFGDHPLSLIPSIVTVIAVVLINWWALNSFVDSVVITVLLYAGYFLVLYINKDDAKFDGQKAFGKASQLLTIPALAMLLTCLFSISMKSSINSSAAAAAMGMTSYLYTLRSSLIIVMIFMIFSLVSYIMGMIKIGNKMNGYVLALIITAVFCASVFYLVTQGLNSLISLL